MKAKTLMVLGSSSSAGKSFLVTALCRIYARRGWRVMPFKAQNMSNNAAVCRGGEIGRAQAMQAFAAMVEPSVDMNPVLLKPEADALSQVILQGQVWGRLSAGEYYSRKQELWQRITQSLDRLRNEADLVIIEGAGSAAELNLKTSDVVNFAVARYAQVPCLLVGDIDRGGIFAQLLGTLWLLEEDERSLMRGFIVNKFRGDRRLFQMGIEILEQRSGIPVLGIIPFLHEHGVAAEDSADIPIGKVSPATAKLDIVIVALPRISNFDEFDALRWTPGVQLRYVSNQQELGNPDGIILPGSKSTIEDLLWLHKTGLDDKLRQCAAQGVSVVGLCGGYQMMGEIIIDEEGVEAMRGEITGLGLLEGRTIFRSQKTVTRTKARVICEHGFWIPLRDTIVEGYEIHLGESEDTHPLFEVIMRNDIVSHALDGSCSEDGRIFGSYLHGLFENDLLRQAWLMSLGLEHPLFSYHAAREQAVERLADAVSGALDMKALDAIVGVF